MYMYKVVYFVLFSFKYSYKVDQDRPRNGRGRGFLLYTAEVVLYKVQLSWSSRSVYTYYYTA